MIDIERLALIAIACLSKQPTERTQALIERIGAMPTAKVSETMELLRKTTREARNAI